MESEFYLKNHMKFLIKWLQVVLKNWFKLYKFLKEAKSLKYTIFIKIYGHCKDNIISALGKIIKTNKLNMTMLSETVDKWFA